MVKVHMEKGKILNGIVCTFLIFYMFSRTSSEICMQVRHSILPRKNKII